jgi:hypothetical protein
MRMTTVALGLAGATAGLVTAVAGYHHAVEAGPRPVAQESSAVNLQASAPEPPVRVFPPVVLHRVAPCRPPAQRVHGSCVTTVHRTVVVYDPAPTPPAGPAVAPAPSARPTRSAGAPRAAKRLTPVARPARPAPPAHRSGGDDTNPSGAGSEDRTGDQGHDD